MTYSMNIKTGFFSVLFALLAFQISAQRPVESKMGTKNPELKKELRAYKDANIKPVMLAKRSSFDQVLSAEDRATIEDVRSQIKAYKATQPHGNNQLAPVQDKNDIAPANKKKSRKGHGNKRGKMGNKFFKENPAELERIKTIADRYAPELEDVENELAPMRKQWKTDLKSIVEKHADDEINQKIEQRKKKGKKNKADRESRARTAFLLMPLK